MDEEKTLSEPTFGDRVKTAISKKSNTKSIPINFPRKTYKRFASWSEENANNCYWLAIDRLLDIYEQRFDYAAELDILAKRDESLAEEIVRLNNRLDELMNSLSAPIKEKKHFGKKEDLKGEENEFKE